MSDYPTAARIGRRRGTRLFGDFSVSEHARNLLTSVRGRKLAGAGRDTLAFVQNILSDEVMMVGARGNLRRVCHSERLHAKAEPRQSNTGRIRDRASDAGTPLPDPSGPPNASSRRRWVEASTNARSSCWPWISAKAAPKLLSTCTPTG
jgi:hypothetical protein